MKIAFCTPFKSLSTPKISGDVTIAEGLLSFFQSQGHAIWRVPQVTTTLIWKQPRVWGKAYSAMQIVKETLTTPDAPDIWFTYHSYYKAPDILGTLASQTGIPYCIFAPSHAPKRENSWSTKPGYYMNLRALQKATHLFTNKTRDIEGLSQVVPEESITFISPGIHTHRFVRDTSKREAYRTEWNAGNNPVVLTIAMLREGTKSEGVEHVINACHTLVSQGQKLTLVVGGDGVMRDHLQQRADELLPDCNVFLGFVPEKELPAVYSSCDVFAFPGINEGLGMVYLEAQCCGLPVVAWDHDGAPQVVQDGKTGFITPSYNEDHFTQAIGSLLSNTELRKEMGEAAIDHAVTHHDITKNYMALDDKMRTIAGV